MSSHHNKKGLLREYLSDCITSATWTALASNHATHESLDPCCCSRGVQHTVLPRHLAVAQCVNKTLFESVTLDGRLRPHEARDHEDRGAGPSDADRGFHHVRPQRQEEEEAVGARRVEAARQRGG